jgi:hypothetical protein
MVDDEQLDISGHSQEACHCEAEALIADADASGVVRLSGMRLNDEVGARRLTDG